MMGINRQLVLVCALLMMIPAGLDAMSRRLLQSSGPEQATPSLAGVTGVPDTSFNMRSAFNSTKKSNPETNWVKEIKYPSVREEQGVVYCAAGDRKLVLDAFYPARETTEGKTDPTRKTGRLRTAVIILHGGGWRSGSRVQHYVLARRLASMGYVCFTPEYRLSTEALFPAGIYDIKASIRWVRTHAADYSVDTSKIAVLGFSAGGEMAAFMGTTGRMPDFEGSACSPGSGSVVNAVIDIDGTLSFVHPESHEGNDSIRTSAATYWFGYAKKNNPPIWEKASPLTYVDRHTPPTLFLNSSLPWMHAGREDYIAVLNKYHIYQEVHNFEGAPHCFCLFEPWFTPTVGYIDTFLKKVFL